MHVDELVTTTGDWTPEKAAAMIDHSLLKPNLIESDLEKGINEALGHCFFNVTVNPDQVSFSKEKVRGSSVKVCSVVSFPFGLSKTEVKVMETREAIRDGADEIDMVLNIGAERSHNYDLVFTDAKAVVDAARKMDESVKVKAILETCYLTDDEKISACEASVKAGMDFVKTSTGYGTAGATMHDVVLMRRVVGPNIGVKAAGGIRDAKAFLALASAGANRIGTSHSVEIMKELASGLR